MSLSKPFKRVTVETEDGTVIETKKPDVEKQLETILSPQERQIRARVSRLKL